MWQGEEWAWCPSLEQKVELAIKNIPDPFPVQDISAQPRPILPFIVLESKGDIVKVVAVRDVGGPMNGGCCIEWGALLIAVPESHPQSHHLHWPQVLIDAVPDINKRWHIVTGSYDRNDPIVNALDNKGVLVPQSIRAWCEK